MPDVAHALASHWMPFTANRDFQAHPRLIVHAEGMVYRSQSGQRVLDGASGLFCCAAGHGRREIAEAVSAQLMEMDYAPHFQFGHPSSFELAARLGALLPGDLDHLFFCNSGSEAIDTALKIAMAYHRANGEGARQRFVSRERAYHGVNIGGTSLSGIVRNREAFPAVMPGVSHMRHTWLTDHRFVRGQPGSGEELASDLQRFVDLHGKSQIAACFVEPIAGSTGVLVPPKGYLERLRADLRRQRHPAGVRRGHLRLRPHRRRLRRRELRRDAGHDHHGQGLTNGSQPMGAVAVRDGIYRALTAGSPPEAIELFHGYTFSAHPAACAAALATLDIYAREELFARAAKLSAGFLDRMFALADIPVITDIRGYGMLAAFDMAPAATPGARGYAALKRLFEAGLLIKWTGDTGIVAPALIATDDELDEIEDKLRRVLATI